jgi:hypothetical protein
LPLRTISSADVLHLAVGEPGPAVGINAGEGVVRRCDEARRVAAGVTLMGLKSRLIEALGRRSAAVATGQ